MNILAIIPARSGSKGIPNKNIKSFKGKPLIYWSIKQAIESEYINKIIVSTDSKKYANIANLYGAEVPFLRPKNISNDLSTDYEFIEHCLRWLKSDTKYYPDIIVQLRPTYPTRTVTKIDETIKLFIDKYDDYDSLRTVIPLNKSPYKMYRIINNQLKPLFQVAVSNNGNIIYEPYNQCRQILPQCYLHNGYIDILKPHIVINKKTISGSKILPYVMNQKDIDDIDTIEDWRKAEKTSYDDILISNNN